MEAAVGSRLKNGGDRTHEVGYRGRGLLARGILRQGADGLDDVLDVVIGEGRKERQAEGLDVKRLCVWALTKGIAVGFAFGIRVSPRQ